ncbi:o-succinylbenzoate--CoA ligase [Vibrio sinaloensis]|uniref:O-succinylbenzoic acid--CoA ligase n=1 Tax=Photobacterium sp. (strain ATCC 43367) TaxID=379097 RepID=A0A0A5JH95_PHOS4|nr:o-succinylbenzoate--CoA ligase [Vibrio sinaloensis]KGY07353.1 O-succinylbenzoic acid--CoA ligase [Vibrio sinaloensis]
MQPVLSPLNQWAQSSPSLLALDTPKKRYTWAELEREALMVAASLSQQGVQSGDVVTCVGKNSPESVILLLATLEIGAVCAFTMPQTESELETKLSTLYASHQQRWIWSPEVSAERTLEYAPSSAEQTSRAYRSDAIATIVFTSGTTGIPKAVAHTSRQHLASAQGLLARFRFQQGDTWLLSLPLYHVSGLAIIYRWLQSGATLKVGSGDLHSDILTVTHASLVATQLKRLLESNVELTLTHVLLGGSHVPLALSSQAAKRGIDTWLGYGMTEAASTVTAKQIDEHYSAGSVLPNRKVKLEDGRIYVGGDTLALGYYRQGAVTPIAEHGWFDTKDLGTWVGGELKIIGRADNLFISGGENIHCEEIEAVLNEFAGVKQAIVIPVADEEFGFRPVAILDAKRLPELSQIETYLEPRLTKFKWPIAYHLLPESLLGNGIKLSRKAVKDWFKEYQALIK